MVLESGDRADELPGEWLHRIRTPIRKGSRLQTIRTRFRRHLGFLFVASSVKANYSASRELAYLTHSCVQAINVSVLCVIVDQNEWKSS